MSDLRLRARSATELVDAAFALYRRDPLPFILLTAFAYSPWLVLWLLVLAFSGGAAAGSVDLAIGIGVGAAVLYLITYSVMSAALVRLASQSYLGQPLDVGAAMREALSRLGAIIGGAIVKSILVMLGGLVFLVGGIYVTARLFAINEAIVLEDLGVGAALSRSGELSRGRKGHILATLGLVFIIYFLVFVAVSFGAAMTRSAVVSQVATTAFIMLAYPLFAITETLLYYDARIRGEGYDIELMAGALGAPAPAAENVAR